MELSRSILVALLICLSAAESAAQLPTFTRADSALGVHVVSATYGPTLGDFDGDRRGDAFITNHASRPNLFRNLGGRFDDILFTAGLMSEADQHGAAWGDCDNDGWLDLYVAVGAGQGQGSGCNELYHNLGGLRFEEIGVGSGTADSLGRGRFAYWVDVNNDGLLDIFVANLETPNRLFLNWGGCAFGQVNHAGGLDASDLWYAGWTDVTGDGDMDVILSGSASERLALFENDGTGRFTDVTPASGLPTVMSGVRSLCWFDYDNDGDQDLYISRGYFSCAHDALWYDSTEARALMTLAVDPESESAQDAIVVVAEGDGLTADVQCDWDPRPLERIYLGPQKLHPQDNPCSLLDGQWVGAPDYEPGVDFGCFIWQDAPGGAWRFCGSTDRLGQHFFGVRVSPFGGPIVDLQHAEMEPGQGASHISDRLYENIGNGRFEYVGNEAGIGDGLDGRSAVAADFNNDGWLDIYVVNARNLSGLWAQNMPNLLYVNDGDGTFSECAVAAGVACQVAGTGAGAAWSDFNGDGFPDLYVTNGWDCHPFCLGPHVIYVNDANSNHWLMVRLAGRTANRPAIGARVRLVAGGQSQHRVQSGGVVDMSQSSMDLQFGLGAATHVDSLIVFWPGGIGEVHTDLAVDRLHLITQGEGQALESPDRLPDRPTLTAALSSSARAPILLTCLLPHSGEIDLAIFDVQGRIIRSVCKGERQAGSHRYEWDGRDSAGRRAPAGIYHARLSVDGRQTKCRFALVE